jgi:hypothetical protein
VGLTPLGAGPREELSQPEVLGRVLPPAPLRVLKKISGLIIPERISILERRRARMLRWASGRAMGVAGRRASSQLEERSCVQCFWITNGVFSYVLS